MKSILILACVSFISCSQFQGPPHLETTNKTVGQTISFSNIQTEELLKKLFNLWDTKDSKLIELELGIADNKIIGATLTTYSYFAKFQTPYEQLILEVSKNAGIKSISYEFLDEKNETLNDQWILGIFKTDKWKLVELPHKTHVFVPKKVLINNEKKIIAGYVEGYKNKQLRFIYFGVIDETKLDLFKWE